MRQASVYCTDSIAGEYYASVESGLGYNSEYEKIPNTPPQYDPSNLFATYDKQTKQVTLEWEDKNGEYNQLMEIQCKKAGTSIWTTVATVEQKEEAATYSETIDGVDGDKFRVRIVDLKGKERLTNEATAVNDNLTFGDDVTVVTSEGTKTMCLGRNILVNGSFDLGTTDWTNAAGEPLTASEKSRLIESAARHKINENQLKFSERAMYESDKASEKIMKGIYERTDSEIAKREARIKELEKALENYKLGEIPFEQIAKEIHSQYPQIGKMFIARGAEIRCDSLASTKGMVLMTESAKPLPADDIRKLESWLKIRLGDSTAVVISK